ncbi:MAG: MFS transporter [Candidatus Uhrbacteria bacterium]
MKPANVYYIFIALLHFGMGVIVTGYVPFLLSIGISLGQVALTNALYWTGIVLLELPTGMLADGRSRAWTLRFGALTLAVSALIYACANGLYMAILAELFGALSIAFQSGALQAWITDALDRDGQGQERRKVFATGAIVGGSSALIGGVLGAGLACLHYRLIWVPLIILSLVAYVFAKRQMNGQGEPLERVTEIMALKQSLVLLRVSRDVRWVILVFILFGTIVCFNIYWSPFFKEYVGQLNLGWVWLIIYFPCIFGGWIVRRMIVPQGQEGNYLVLSLIGTGTGMMLLAFVGPLYAALAAVVVHEISRGLFEPLNDSFVQHRVSSSYRATFGSLQSLIGRIGFALVPLVTWICLPDFPDSTATIRLIWLVAGSVLVIGTLLLWLVRPRI